MASLFYRTVTAPTPATISVRLGASGTAFNPTEERKLVKPSGDSGYVLCAVGDLFDGQIAAVSGTTLTAGGFQLGAVQRQSAMWVMADGAQATGIGNLAIGDAVVCGTPVAQGTQLPYADCPKVRKATLQPNVTVPAALSDVPAHINAASYWWKVVSLYTSGTGAPGTLILIERVNY
jgi:hypothetical protein